MELSLRNVAMPASPIRKLVPYADEAKSRGIKVYHLNIGQPDIETPPEMIDALKDYNEKVLAYGPSPGLLETRKAVSVYMRGLGLDIEPCDVTTTVGGSEALMFAMLALCNPGDEIIVFEPFYTNYAGFACMTGVKLVPVETHVDKCYRLPSDEEITAKISHRTRAFLYSSPGNPTGTVLNRGEVSRLVALAAKHDFFIIADEVYREFVYGDAQFNSALDVATQVNEQDRIILIDSISKRFSACGSRIGFLITKNKKIQDLALRFGQARLCPPTIDQLSAIAGYKVVDKYVPPMIDEYRQRRDVVMQGLAKIPGCVCGCPEGAFYLQPSLPIDDGDKFARFMLTDFSSNGETVMVAPGAGFYATPGKGKSEIRIAYVLEQHHLRRAMEILAEGVIAYNARKTD
jgi:aspartate aminotransferase